MLFEEIGKIWPNAKQSYALSKISKFAEFPLALKSIGKEGVMDISSGKTHRFPPDKVLINEGTKAAIDAIEACPMNPKAWFQLNFHLIMAGFKDYAEETCNKTKMRLEEAQQEHLLHNK